MTAMRYKFVDGLFEIEFADGKERYCDFKSEGSDSLSKITVCDFECIGADVFGVEYIQDSFAHIMRAKNNRSSLLLSNEDRSESVICKAQNGEYAEELMIAAVYSSLCRHRTLFLHASVVDYNGEGIVFVGPSGIGKTTQAELWQKYENAEILNGDKAFIRAYDDEIFVYGSPWKGSSDYCVNRRSKLRGIIVLRQNSENSVRLTDELGKAELFLPHVFLPHWDKECTECALDTLDEIIKRVPVYLLECRADREAVEITKRFVFDD